MGKLRPRCLPKLMRPLYLLLLAALLPLPARAQQPIPWRAAYDALRAKVPTEHYDLSAEAKSAGSNRDLDRGLTGRGWRLRHASWHLRSGIAGDDAAPWAVASRAAYWHASHTLPLAILREEGRLEASFLDAPEARVAVAGAPFSLVVDPALIIDAGDANVWLNVEGSSDVRRMIPGEPLRVHFDRPGTQMVVVTIAMPGHAATTLAVPLEVAPARAPCQTTSTWRCPDVMVDSVMSTFTYDASYYEPGSNPRLQAFDGVKGAPYRYAIYFGAGNTTGKLHRPIIVTDGLDVGTGFGNARTPADIFNRLLNRDSVNMGIELLAEGYDVVIFDYGNSLDFIQRNGLALAHFIAYVNANLAPGGSIQAVVGPSLGGIVARYALAWMESTRRPHHVPLFVSYDGAQQGGHIPIGVQQLVDDILHHSVFGLVLDLSMGDFTSVAEGVLRAPAVRQLLVFNAFEASFTANSTAFTFTHDVLKARLYSDLMAVGDYPAQSRNVAVVNGSPAALDQLEADAPGDRLLPGETLLTSEIEAWLVGHWKMVTTARAAPAMGQRSTVYARSDYACGTLCRDSDYFDGSQWVLGEARPYSSAPGGYRTTTRDLVQELDSLRGAGLTWEEVFRRVSRFQFAALIQPIIGMVLAQEDPMVIRLHLTAPAYHHAFVHTVSALDYNTTVQTRGSFVQNLFTAQNLTHNVLQDSPAIRVTRSPFARSYLAGDAVGESRESQEHVFLTRGIADFLKAELHALPQPNPTYTFSQTVPGGTFASGTVVTVSDYVTVTFSGPVTVQSDVHFKLGRGARIRFDKQVQVLGTAIAPVFFEGTTAAQWSGVLVYGAGSVFQQARFTGGAYALQLRAPDIRIYDSVWMGNGTAVYVYGGTVSVFRRNTVMQNAGHGVYVGYAASISMASASRNTIHDNGGYEIYLMESTSARAYLGTVATGGYNAIYDDDGRALVYDAAKTLTGSSFTVDAIQNWWGFAPPSPNAFYGAVTYWPYLGSNPNLTLTLPCKASTCEAYVRPYEEPIPALAALVQQGRYEEALAQSAQTEDPVEGVLARAASLGALGRERDATEVLRTLDTQETWDPALRVQEEVQSLPEALTVHLYPSLSSGVVTLSISLRASGEAAVEVYDALGRRVERYPTAVLGAGETHLMLDLSTHSAGLYFVRAMVTTGTGTRTQTLSLHLVR